MKLFSIILSSIVFLGCSHSIQEQISVPLIEIDVDQTKTLNLSDFFTDISYVSLSDSFLVGIIETAKIYDDKLFLLTNKSILIFDINSGDLLLNVRHLGRGPGEYISLYDMLYDKNENTIELLDMNAKKVLKYSFDNQFIDEFTTSFFSFSFYKIDQFTYLFYNNNVMSDVTNHKLIQYDSKTSKIKASHFPIDRHLANYFFVIDVNNFGSMVNSSFHFSPSDTIYGFTENYGLYPKYVLNFGKYHTPKSFYKENYIDIYDFSVKAVEKSYIYTYTNFCENDYIAALYFRNDQKLYWVLYDKNIQTVWTIDSWIDDFHFNTSVNIDYNNVQFIMDNDYLYFFLQPDQFINLMNDKKGSKFSPNDWDMFNHIYSLDFSEESNPILVKCKFKKS
ncbi:MAG: 6-bladed beta-propeller [Tannerellaceae bacterium]|jgi:hypothetical protein|nr:6-bladed beta-propeller [Tannerellaceae bacterium]